MPAAYKQFFFNNIDYNNSSTPLSIPAPISRANAYSSMFYTIPPNGPIRTNCTNTLCFTANHNYIYHPHSAYGLVGTTAASYLARRRRL